jgi:hypothetical protein
MTILLAPSLAKCMTYAEAKVHAENKGQDDAVRRLEVHQADDVSGISGWSHDKKPTNVCKHSDIFNIDGIVRTYWHI